MTGPMPGAASGAPVVYVPPQLIAPLSPSVQAIALCLIPKPEAPPVAPTGPPDGTVDVYA